jgi:Lar family restriction alleviation protein
VSESLKPCPFCGDPDVKLFQAHNTDDGARWVECINCLTEGPVGFTDKSAVDAWNRRAEVPA